MLPYSPLHHLLLADAGATARDDERQRVRRADRLPGRGRARAARRHRRPASCSTTGRSRRAPTTPWCGSPAGAPRRSSGARAATCPTRSPCRSTAARTCSRAAPSSRTPSRSRRAGAPGLATTSATSRTTRRSASFTEGIDHFQRLFAVEPEVVAHDLHPEYLSTKYAKELDGVRLIGVQHHHAHLAACLAEHGATGPAVGRRSSTAPATARTAPSGAASCCTACSRASSASACSSPCGCPGGEAAIRQPWRMACAWLCRCLRRAAAMPPRRCAGWSARESWSQVAELARTGVASPLTSSAGRLFDAVAALCGLRAAVNYEGQAAVELEAAADPAEHGAYPLPIRRRGRWPARAGRPATVRPRWPISMPVPAPDGRGPLPQRAGRGHRTACELAAERRRSDTVVLSGGVFQNRLLLDRTASLLKDGRPAGPDATAAPAQRRRHRVRAAGSGRGQTGRRKREACVRP